MCGPEEGVASVEGGEEEDEGEKASATAWRVSRTAASEEAIRLEEPIPKMRK